MGKKKGGVHTMIDDLIKAFRAAGIEVPDTVARDVEVQVRRDWGGERVYIPSLPKQRRAVQLAKLNLRTQREMAVATGLSVRGVRKILRGR